MMYDIKFQPKQSYTYSDIGIVPLFMSNIKSRKTNCDTSFDFLGINLSLPIILAPMESVVGEEMALAIHKLGGLAILPRTGQDNGIDLAYKIGHKIGHDKVVASVSVHPSNEPNLDTSLLHENNKMVCIDVANGFHSNVREAVRAIKSYFPEVKIITGNVASIEGYKFLAELGVDAVRVGIGGGSVCTTSIATGIGIGQASIVRDIANWRAGEKGWYGDHLNNKFPLIIADGGIKTPGDVVKAITLGADCVMIGGLFAGAEESPGRVVKFGDRKYKHLAGQASMFIKGQNEYAEGADRLVPYTKGIEKTWKAFKEGIESGMAYLDCRTTDELRYLPDVYFRLLSNAVKTERNIHA